jgi:hypothetical protein
MSSYQVDYSMEDIAKIIQGLTKHSLEPECKHSFDEIMESIFNSQIEKNLGVIGQTTTPSQTLRIPILKNQVKS